MRRCKISDWLKWIIKNDIKIEVCINENFVVVYKIKEILFLNKLVFIGMVIFDISKFLGYDLLLLVK